MSHSLDQLLDRFETPYPEELAYKARFYELLKEPWCFERKNLKGHFTGSCWVTNPSRDKVLMLHHVKLDRWLQPGGHADGNEDLLAVAMKELEEETGIMDYVEVTDQLFDIDVHTIPARKNVPEHEHFDSRFHFIVKDNLTLNINEESKALQWVPIDSVPELTNNEASFIRMVDKTKAL